MRKIESGEAPDASRRGCGGFLDLFDEALSELKIGARLLHWAGPSAQPNGGVMEIF